MTKTLVALTLVWGMGVPAVAESTGFTLWIQTEMWDGENIVPDRTKWNSLKTYENLAHCLKSKKRAFESGWKQAQAYTQKPNIEKLTKIPNKVIRLHFADGKHSTAKMYQCIPEMADPRK